MEVYVKPAKKASVRGKTAVKVGDVCELSAPKETIERLRGLDLKALDTKEDKAYIVSILDIINVIQRAFPSCTVVNVGEMETLVESAPHPKKPNAVWNWAKVVFIAVVLFVGSSTAIMSFHSDSQMPQVFQNYYKIFFGAEKEKPLIIELPYSLGLAVGIIVFFNHFAGRKMTKDPTPIEVEMQTYESDVTDTKLDTLNKKKEGAK